MNKNNSEHKLHFHHDIEMANLLRFAELYLALSLLVDIAERALLVGDGDLVP